MTMHVLYATTTDRVIDGCLEVDGQPTDFGLYSRKSKDEMENEYGPMIVLPAREASERAEAATLERNRGVTAISAERFTEALHCLPPMKWTVLGDVESFRISEPYSWGLHHAYVRIGQRHFCLLARLSATHADLVCEVNTAVQTGTVKTVEPA